MKKATKKTPSKKIKKSAAIVKEQSVSSSTASALLLVNFVKIATVKAALIKNSTKIKYKQRKTQFWKGTQLHLTPRLKTLPI